MQPTESAHNVYLMGGAGPGDGHALGKSSPQLHLFLILLLLPADDVWLADLSVGSGDITFRLELLLSARFTLASIFLWTVCLQGQYHSNGICVSCPSGRWGGAGLTNSSCEGVRILLISDLF
jgi:hypothetical protein